MIIEYSDNWDDGFDTVTIAREFAYEPEQRIEVRYLPVVGRHDNENPTMVDMPAIGAE